MDPIIESVNQYYCQFGSFTNILGYTPPRILCASDAPDFLAVSSCLEAVKVIPHFSIAHFFCAYPNVAYGIIYKDKLNCKRQKMSKDKQK